MRYGRRVTLIDESRWASVRRWWWRRRRSPRENLRRSVGCYRNLSTTSPPPERFGGWIKEADRDQIFGDYADLYEKNRPSYPESIFRTIFDAVRVDLPETSEGRSQRVNVLDCATGTGRGAFKMLSLYGDMKKSISSDISSKVSVGEILGTDVDQGMIDVARSNALGTTTSTTDVDFIVAKAEGLGDAIERRDRERSSSGTRKICRRFHLVTVFQAWHWFDSERVLKELQERVLISGGILAVAWNDRDLSVPWVSQLEDMIERYNPKYDRSVRQCDQFEPVLTQGNRFELLSRSDTSHIMPLAENVGEDNDDGARALLDMTRTFSYVRNVLDRRTKDDAFGWDAWEQDVRSLARSVSLAPNEPFGMPLQTRLYVLRSKPQPAA